MERYSLRFGRRFRSPFLIKHRFHLTVVFILFLGGTIAALAKTESSLVIEPSSWAVIGPFDNPKEIGGDTVYPPEYEIQLDASYGIDKRGRRINWQRLFWMKDMDENLNFASFYPDGGGVAYAFTTLYSAKRREVLFKFESESQVRVWVNGKQVLDRTAGIDSLHTVVGLESGWNQILVKTYSGNGQWCLLMRIEPRHGEPLTDILCKLPDKNLWCK